MASLHKLPDVVLKILKGWRKLQKGITSGIKGILPKPHHLKPLNSRQAGWERRAPDPGIIATYFNGLGRNEVGEE